METQLTHLILTHSSYYRNIKLIRATDTTKIQECSSIHAHELKINDSLDESDIFASTKLLRI
jgi:hypothetical protein